ncbi:MAG: glycoside hydrolase domain-containing protein [Nocardioides sp.]|uniref:glycoside hydrolase domain-containing protein n=1 Tax=Nocardioides sp. TaxID=35761 RepID=UPI003F123B63
MRDLPRRPLRAHLRRTALRTLAAGTALVAAVGVVSALGLPSGGDDDALAPVKAARKASAAQIVAATPGNFTGYGFDQCLTPTQSAMDAWRAHSPFTAVGIYISGDSRACRNQPNLTTTWVQNQVAAGWRLLPIALGPQASCLSRFPRYSDDFSISPDPANNYAKARKMGRQEASKNVADAAALGIGQGSTIWYDLEGFDMSKTHCRESALRFTHAWVTRAKALGYVAGFYSSASSGIKMLDDARRKSPGVYNLPDRIWIARWDGVANTSTSYISDDGWNPGGRMKQYRGGHNEKWGGVTINIDSNYLDLGTGSTGGGARLCDGVKVGFATYSTLAPGTKRAGQVKALQCLLRETGHHTGRITGGYNLRTQKAVMAWQASRGFAATTTFTNQHWVSLLAGTGNDVIKRGSTGQTVYRLQRALNATGAVKLPRTGVFDAATEAAVVAYQKRNKLVAGGVGTAQTWSTLGRGVR